MAMAGTYREYTHPINHRDGPWVEFERSPFVAVLSCNILSTEHHGDVQSVKKHLRSMPCPFKKPISLVLF